MKRIAIIGAGAAGCFAAQRIRELCPQLEVRVFEAQDRPLKKVAVTGGGRCNLTNSFNLVGNLAEVYPRGHRLMKKLMYEWNQWDTMSWFEEHGVHLVTQEDECVFPRSQRAMEIVNVLRGGLDIQCSSRLTPDELLDYDAVVVTTGGARDLSWFQRHGLEIVPPVPSLFPFKLESTGLERLSGTLVSDSVAAIGGTSHRAVGTTLITHDGLSGPCILRLSSYAARYLWECGYRANLVMNWLGGASGQETMDMLHGIAMAQSSRLVANYRPEALTSRHWEYLIARAGIEPGHRWSGVGRKQMNRLAAVLTSDNYSITGRVPHKEEFVTAGGIGLTNVDASTLRCKAIPRLYFAGEVLDVDGVTGGFNLQAAWTMADTVARALEREYKSVLLNISRS
ncbi:MAG: aminoacetone oxidase family FAD-binding enzyme [Bacteroides sp.]|nr:aminoacetone oxidase family FAD-binding enzyme [Bacteroides sp.]MCM1446811.1 aminoacetone oxidase family FAD-binding enzyme [Bacteroides sp.]